MNHSVPRRRILKLAVAAGAGGARWVFPRPAAAKPSENSGRLLAYQDGPQIWVRFANHVLTSYRAHPTQKYPYWYPLAGPVFGRSLTAETALPWPHHRSMLLACDHVNGGNYWQGEIARGQIVSSGPRLGPTTPESVVVLDRCTWRPPGKPAVLVDERRFTITVPGPRQWWIDADITLTAQADVKITKTNHSFFAIRAATDIVPTGGGTLINSEGQTREKNTFGRAAKWCDFSGKRRGSDVVEGITLMDHPNNPWSPCRWFTRDYGFISPTPFYWLGEAGWALPAGKAVRVRYRVCLHAGDAKEAGLREVYRDWTAR